MSNVSIVKAEKPWFTNRIIPHAFFCIWFLLFTMISVKLTPMVVWIMSAFILMFPGSPSLTPYMVPPIPTFSLEDILQNMPVFLKI